MIFTTGTGGSGGELPYVVGSYYGSGSATRTISVGFRPSAVIVTDISSSSVPQLAITGRSSSGISIVSNGFSINSIEFNNEEYSYTYIAFK